MDDARDVMDELAPKHGEILTTGVSRVILMIYFGFIKSGISPNQAAIKASTSRPLLGSFCVIRIVSLQQYQRRNVSYAHSYWNYTGC